MNYATFDTWKDSDVPLETDTVKTKLGEHIVTEMSAHDLSMCQSQARKSNDFIDINSIWAAWTLVGSGGKRIFDPSNPAHIDIISEKGSSIVNPIFTKAQELNRLNQSQEEAKKNS